MRFTSVLVGLALVAACAPAKLKLTNHDLGGRDGAGNGAHPDAALTPSGNVAALLVDSGPLGNSTDVAYISVTLCAPGTTTCQTIDHISIDTGSVGLRVISSVIDASVVAALPALDSASGTPVSECYTYADGYVYGSVRKADLTLAGEHVPSMAFQLIGDLTDAPSDCTSSGASENTVETFGGNGIIGIAPFVADCGEGCAQGSGGNPSYYDCAGAGGCAPAMVATTQQVQNPISLFGNDSNGYSIEFPAVDDMTGASNLAGTLTFGVGTRDNNALGSQRVYAAAASSGLATVTAVVQGQTFSQTIFDSGTSELAVSLGLPACTQAQSFLCPSSEQTFTANLTDANGATGTTTFSIANAETLLGNSPSSTAFDDIAGDGVDGLLILGLPFFYGRTIYFAIDGATTSGGPGPYYAF